MTGGQAFVRAEFAVVQVIAVDVGGSGTVHAGAGLGRDAVVGVVGIHDVEREYDENGEEDLQDDSHKGITN